MVNIRLVALDLSVFLVVLVGCYPEPEPLPPGRVPLLEPLPPGRIPLVKEVNGTPLPTPQFDAGVSPIDICNGLSVHLDEIPNVFWDSRSRVTDTTAELTLEDGTRLVQNTNGWRYAFSPTRTVVEVSISPDGAAHCDIG